MVVDRILQNTIISELFVGTEKSNLGSVGHIGKVIDRHGNTHDSLYSAAIHVIPQDRRQQIVGRKHSAGVVPALVYSNLNQNLLFNCIFLITIALKYAILDELCKQHWRERY